MPAKYKLVLRKDMRKDAAEGFETVLRQCQYDQARC